MTTLIDVSVKAPKELNDVRIALIDLVQLLKDGKGLADILGKLSEFTAAINGAQAIPTELKEELKASVATIGLLGGELAGVLLS